MAHVQNIIYFNELVPMSPDTKAVTYNYRFCKPKDCPYRGGGGTQILTTLLNGGSYFKGSEAEPVTSILGKSESIALIWFLLFIIHIVLYCIMRPYTDGPDWTAIV